MKYFKVIYKLGANNSLQYPSGIKNAVWNIVQYHHTENIMVGGTDSIVEADGVEVIELNENEALSLIEEFKKSYPEIKEEDLPFLLGTEDESKSI